jgi:hypothetical protein
MNTTPNSLPVDEIIGNPNILTFAGGDVTEADMPRTAVEEYWDLLLTGTLTNAGYVLAPPVSYIEAMLNIVYQILVNASAAVKGGVNEAFKNIDLAYLAFIDYIYQGIWPDQNFGDYVIGTANAALPFSVTPRLYFTDPLSHLPSGKCTAKSTMLDTRLLSSLKFDVGWRKSVAMVYGGDPAGTSTLSGLQIQVKALHYYGVPNVGPNNVTIVRNYLREVQQLYPVAATAIDTQFNNLRVGAILHRLTIKSIVAPTGAPANVSFADPSDVLLQGNTTRSTGSQLTLKVNNNAYVPLQIPTKQLQISNVNTFKLTKGIVPGYEVYETSGNHNPRAMLNLRSAINMILFADTEVTAAVQNNVQFTYVERVTPQ